MARSRLFRNMSFSQQRERLKSALLFSKLTWTWMESCYWYFRWGNTFLLVWYPRHNCWRMTISYFVNIVKKLTSAYFIQQMSIRIWYSQGSNSHWHLKYVNEMKTMYESLRLSKPSWKWGSAKSGSGVKGAG